MVDTVSFRLSSPRVFLIRIVVFLLLVGFVALILYRQIGTAFMANPGLNALILGVLLFGIVLGIRQVVRLFREVRWANAVTGPQGAANVPAPTLLSPVSALLGERIGGVAISTTTLRAILDAVGMRLDESREIARYLTGLLVFLGLLGTFYGLLETVGSISGVIRSMGGNGDAGVMFDELKNGLAAPIAGMSISFTSSLFGLAGSLILGFLDLQAGQAQNRFYTEIEDGLSSYASDAAAPARGMPSDLKASLDKIAASADQTSARASTAAMANLAEGIQGLVQHMRSEQQLIRDWVEAQADQQTEIRKLLERLAAEKEVR